MATTPLTRTPYPGRLRLAEVIVRRPRVNLAIGLLLALAFALVVAPIVMAEAWLVDAKVTEGMPAPVTVRVKTFEGLEDGQVGGHGGSVVIAANERATPAQALLAEAAQRNAPRGPTGFAAFAAVLFAIAAGVTHHLQRSNRGRLLRVQLVLLGSVAAGAAVTKGLLLLFPVSVLAVPVALGAVVPTLVFDRTVGLAGGVLAAVVMSLLVPFDVGVTSVLVVQAVAAAIVIPERPRARLSLVLASGLAATVAAALTYLAFSYLSNGVVPTAELAEPLRSSWVAAAVGGVMSGLLALWLLPLFQLACGEITQGTLVALEDLSHPLLRQIAEKSPGTWQHSLAMANMAEIAANSISANGRLVRVGAYFHDLGKSLQPTYFIENLGAGEPSPHDRLAPEVSCDAIFAHVTEGLALARRMKLPERIIDFMHMHHGDGVLEYFWAKCQETGNPRRLSVEDFRYPGVPPQSRETAILAICDAVEAASRTLKRPDERSIEHLVQRIVYGKLHLGQLDESGLSMGDLRRINNSLKETIRHAHHGRIEYPWQREEAAEAAVTAATIAGRAATATQRLMNEPRLDSLDVPRPLQWEDTGRPKPPALVMDTPRPHVPTGPTVVLPVATTTDAGIANTLPMPSPSGPISVEPVPVPAPASVPAPAPVAAPVAAPVPVPAPVAAPVPAPVPVPATETVSLKPTLIVVDEPEPEPEPAPPPTRDTDVISATAPTAQVAVTDAEAAAAMFDAVAFAPTATMPSMSPMPTTLPGIAGPLRPPADSGAIPTAIPASTGSTGKSGWASSLAHRLDTMLDAAEADAVADAVEDAFASEPTKRVPPPPPRRKAPTHEIEGEEIEATIELSPHARPEPSGIIVGPPPGTKPGRQATTEVAPFSDDEGPTVVRKPASSGLPPRARQKPE